jgi:Mce-associated membrane protein
MGRHDIADGGEVTTETSSAVVAPDVSSSTEESVFDVRDGDLVEDDTEDADPGSGSTGARRRRHVGAVFATPLRQTIVVGLVMSVALGALLGWWSYRVQQTNHEHERELQFVEAGKQGAINLTSVDYHDAAKDVSRIMATSTGFVNQNFQERGPQFIQLVQQVKATTKGRVTEAGLESIDGDEARVLLAVQVDRWVNDAPQEPSYFRMRVDVQHVGSEMKMSNVEFVA